MADTASAPAARARKFPPVAAKNGVDWLFVGFIVVWQLFMLVVCNVCECLCQRVLVARDLSAALCRRQQLRGLQRCPCADNDIP